MGKRIPALILLSCILLGAGLTGPSMTVTPHFGQFSQVVAAIMPGLTKPEQFSVLRAVFELLRGDWAELFVG